MSQKKCWPFLGRENKWARNDYKNVSDVKFNLGKSSILTFSCESELYVFCFRGETCFLTRPTTQSTPYLHRWTARGRPLTVSGQEGRHTMPKRSRSPEGGTGEGGNARGRGDLGQANMGLAGGGLERCGSTRELLGNPWRGFGEEKKYPSNQKFL